MTLPYPDRPSISTSVKTILSDTLANLTFLDAVEKFKHVNYAFTPAALSGTATITVGFQPGAIIVFANAVSQKVCSIGFCGLSSGYVHLSYYMYLNSDGIWKWEVNSANWSIYLKWQTAGDPSTNHILQAKAARVATGVYLQWWTNNLSVGEVKFTAFCFK